MEEANSSIHKGSRSNKRKTSLNHGELLPRLACVSLLGNRTTRTVAPTNNISNPINVAKPMAISFRCLLEYLQKQSDWVGLIKYHTAQALWWKHV